MLPDKINTKEVQKFCKENNIIKLALFGSILSSNFKSDKSDIDILVEFEKDKHPSLAQFAGLEIKLSMILGRKVDLKTKEDLSIYFRDDVVNQAQMVYELGIEYDA